VPHTKRHSRQSKLLTVVENASLFSNTAVEAFEEFQAMRYVVKMLPSQRFRHLDGLGAPHFVIHLPICPTLWAHVQPCMRFFSKKTQTLRADKGLLLVFSAINELFKLHTVTQIRSLYSFVGPG